MSFTTSNGNPTTLCSGAIEWTRSENPASSVQLEQHLRLSAYEDVYYAGDNPARRRMQHLAHVNDLMTQMQLAQFPSN